MFGLAGKDEINLQNNGAPRIGDWIATYTGKAVFPMDLRAEDIDIIDIAHSLSLQCRFNGHCLRFYSVAEHSVLVSRWLLEEYGHTAALCGLLHDATEAYLTDVPRPVKPFLHGYKEAELNAWYAVAARFGLDAVFAEGVHEADNRILFDEKAQNMGVGPDWSWAMEPLGVSLQFWTPEQAKAEFLKTFWNLIETGTL
jgi:hypothetical protein